MKRVMVPLLALPLVLSACATPETRLRNGLQNAGLSKAMSTCMAGRMVDRLSLVQLRRLSALGSLKDREITDLTLDQFFRMRSAAQETEIRHTVQLSVVGERCVHEKYPCKNHPPGTRPSR